MPVRGFSFAPLAGLVPSAVPPARPLSPARTGDVTVMASAAANAGATSRASVVMACPSLDVGLAGRPAVAELAAVGQRDLLQEPARFATAKGRDDHRDHVTLLDHVELPADAIEDAGARALDGVVLHVSALLREVQAVHLDVDVRVRPLEVLHRARDLHLMIVIEHGERVVREARARGEECRRTEYCHREAAPTGFHERYSFQ